MFSSNLSYIKAEVTSYSRKALESLSSDIWFPGILTDLPRHGKNEIRKLVPWSDRNNILSSRCVLKVKVSEEGVAMV